MVIHLFLVYLKIPFTRWNVILKLLFKRWNRIWVVGGLNYVHQAHDLIPEIHFLRQSRPSRSYGPCEGARLYILYIWRWGVAQSLSGKGAWGLSSSVGTGQRVHARGVWKIIPHLLYTPIPSVFSCSVPFKCFQSSLAVRSSLDP